MRLSHQSQRVCQQKDLSCFKEMAWKDSNDLPFVMELSPSSLFSFPLLISYSNVFFLFYCRGLASACVGGRGVVVGPIVSQILPDVFCDNEYGPNFLFRNNGDGTFTDVAQQAGETPSSVSEATSTLSLAVTPRMSPQAWRTPCSMAGASLWRTSIVTAGQTLFMGTGTDPIACSCS